MRRSVRGARGRGGGGVVGGRGVRGAARGCLVAGLSRCSKEVGETVLVTSRETYSCLVG